MLHPPKPTNGAQILIRQVFLHTNQSSNLLYPSDPVLFQILDLAPQLISKVDLFKTFTSFVALKVTFHKGDPSVVKVL